MSLAQELKLHKGFATPGHEALLSIYFTAALIKKFAVDFLKPYGLTDVQLNLMMLLKYQAQPGQGLSQAELSDMMLVNRPNITSLIDRMEAAGYVLRTDIADRRFNMIKLTRKGRNVLSRVEPHYAREVERIASVLNPNDQIHLIALLETMRKRIRP
jgi:DNA-binding MarR family transcriptional regulator